MKTMYFQGYTLPFFMKKKIYIYIHIYIYFLRTSRLKFADFLEYFDDKPEAEIEKKKIISCV